MEKQIGWIEVNGKLCKLMATAKNVIVEETEHLAIN